MSWRQYILETLGTGGLGGMSASTWFQSLHDNRYAIDPPWMLRAAITTFSCLQNSCWRRAESWRFGKQIEQAKIHPPIFILGLWRSGTTHLHNLFAQDSRFAYPNTCQVFFPHTFLTTEAFNAGVMKCILPEYRVQDRVKLGPEQPQEDDFAICGMTGESFMMSIAFPRRAEAYSRFITMEQTTPLERQRWREALTHFLKKLTLKYDRPLVLKSPAHTAHVRELVSMFPDARFVLIHRDPCEVYSSSIHCFKKVFNMWALQRLGDYDIGAATIRNYREVTEKYFAERAFIPQGRLIEVSFDELDRQPIQVMRRVYRSLSLPAFETVEETMQNYLQSLGTYRKNRHIELSAGAKARLSVEWRAWIENWGYDDPDQVRRAA